MDIKLIRVKFGISKALIATFFFKLSKIITA